MIFIIIGALAGFVVGWLITTRPKCNLGDYVEGVFMSILVAIMGFLIGLGIAYGVGAAMDKEYVMDRQIELAAIRDTSGIEGSFFLGTGSIKSQFYYVFYQKEPSGGIRFGKVSVKDAIVYEQERENGLIKAYTRQFTSGWHNYFAVTWGEKYEIFIPKGSILREFQLNLK